jgi:hypothetical protein
MARDLGNGPEDQVLIRVLEHDEIREAEDKMINRGYREPTPHTTAGIHHDEAEDIDQRHSHARIMEEDPALPFKLIGMLVIIPWLCCSKLMCIWGY